VFYFLINLWNNNLSAQSCYTYIDPFIGSQGKGNVFVGPSCPYGMAKPGPDCSVGSNSGYVADTLATVFGFSQVHVSGTGGGPKYGNISVMPLPVSLIRYFRNHYAPMKKLGRILWS
jgi:putative alpha-1,2-mannosidase